MKNTIFFFALLVAFASGCYKPTDAPNVQDTIQSSSEPNVVAVIERDGGTCCCSLVVSSTYFAGLTICGLDPGDAPQGSCDQFCTTNCGQSTGFSKTFPVGKDPLFCIYDNRPFRITNNGSRPIQIFFICNNSTPSTPTWIPAFGSVIFTNDCNGTTTLCTETPCGG